MNKNRLTSGLDPEQIDALGDLSGVEAQLNAYAIPEPDTAALLARLTTPEHAASPILDWRGWLRLAQTQTLLLSIRFWWATLIILALGILLVTAYGGAMLAVYALCSPVLAVAVSAYLFRAETPTLREFELFSGYGALELLYVRLLLVLAYTFIVTLLLLLAASTQGVNVILWRLLVIWLGPMVGLTGLALYATVRWNAFAGGALPIGAWALMLILGWRDSIQGGMTSFNASQFVTAAISQSDALLFGALAGFIGGAALIWQAGVWVAQGEAAP
jgi:hypothetical protein